MDPIDQADFVNLRRIAALARQTDPALADTVGRVLQRFAIHHIDGNRLNNDLSNLRVVWIYDNRRG